MNAFDQKKSSILKEIGVTSPDSPDASPKGTIDVLCLPIMEVINSHPDMVTTSLCSGRVSVFLEGIKKETQVGAKGNEGRWLFVTHHPEELPNWFKSIDFKYQDTIPTSENQRYILFKFEPLILHVKCRDQQSANLLYSTAMGCGYRESGIGSNNIVGIRTSMRLDIPIGCMSGDSLVSFVSESYLELLTKLSEERFAENFRKMDVLKNAIANMGQAKIKEPTETKEERRLRKIAEGMARRDGVRQEKEKKKKEKEFLKQAETSSASQ